MSNCLFTIEIKNYEATSSKTRSITFEDFECVFRLDSNEDKIALKEYQTASVVFKANQIRRDVKINVKVSNAKQIGLIGIFDIVVPFSKIQSAEKNSSFVIEKKIPLTMIDSTKRALFGSLVTNCNIFFDISVDVKNVQGSKVLSKSKSVFKNKKNENGNIKMPLSPKIEKNAHNKFKLDMEIQKEFSTLKTPPSGNYKHKKKFLLDVATTTYNKTVAPKQKKGRYGTAGNSFNSNNNKRKINGGSMPKPKSSSVNQSINMKEKTNVKMMEYKNELLDEDFHNDSLIPSVLITDNNLNYDKEKSNEIESIDNEIINVDTQIFSNYETIKESKEINEIKEKMKTQIENIIHYNILINNRICKVNDKNIELKDTLMKMNEKHNLIIKKKSRLNELNAKIDNKSSIVVNRANSNKITSSQPKIKKNELKMYQHMLNKFYFEYDILKFSETESAKNLDDEIKKKLLLNAVKGTVNSYGNISNLVQMLPTAEKEKLKSILLKNNIKELPEPRLTKIKAITEEDEDQEEDDEESGKKHNEEEKIEEILEKIVKEKKCKTTFKKIVGNTYLYGNQRVTAKLEGEEVKIMYGNNITYIPVEEFIDINQNKTTVKKNNRKSSLKTKKGVPKK